MRLIALLILSSISTAFLASCVQSDEEYFKQLKREGISQEQKNQNGKVHLLLRMPSHSG